MARITFTAIATIILTAGVGMLAGGVTGSHAATVAQSQCPQVWQVWDCDAMTPPMASDIEAKFGEIGDWHPAFNSASSDCVDKMGHFMDKLPLGRLYHAEDAGENVHGRWSGAGDGAGNILIADPAFGYGDVNLMRTVIHEVAHDFGCNDDDADLWEAFCVDYDWQSTPPPATCANWP